NDLQDAMTADHEQDLAERRREREAEYAFDAWNVAVAMGQGQLLGMGLADEAARLENLKRGTSGYEAEHAPDEREERPGGTSGWEAEQKRERRDDTDATRHHE
ncbi:MAG TPA: hypothetical protein VMY35_02695, partial [Phycisphaerae bacterium]|nr:hypothetical protein [Phycisphaerae bacterium]